MCTGKLKSLIIIAVVSLPVTICPAQNDIQRKHHLDSISQAIEKRMRLLDTTLLQFDEKMDSLTGKSRKKIDTVELLRQWVEERQRAEREYQITRWGIIAVLTTLILAILYWKLKWNFRVNKGR